MHDFDLVIVGGGASAFGAAIRANELGAKTALINAGLPLGGTCVNVGCVPSKGLLHAGELLHNAMHHGIPGINLKVQGFDFQKVVRDELDLVDRFRRQKYQEVLADLKHVSLIEGRAKFVSRDAVEVNRKKINSGKFIVATGSTARVPSIKGIRQAGFITHIEALRLEKQPQELTIIGAGPVGLELAQMFARFGTQVTLLQRGQSVLPYAEKNLVNRLLQYLSEEGISISTGVEVLSAHIENSRKTITYSMGGEMQEIGADEILLTAGKTPNTLDLGLDQAGVEVDGNHAVIVNQYSQTSSDYILAAGDVTNRPLRLETTAAREGSLAAENVLRGTTLSIDYTTVPYAIFTDPQLAAVGLTEEQQMRQLGVCACRTVSFKQVPKATITRRTEGLIKMVIHPETGQVTGVHILAPNAGDLIAQAMTIVMNKNTYREVANSFPVFPTMSEALKLVALSFTKDISKLSCCI